MIISDLRFAIKSTLCDHRDANLHSDAAINKITQDIYNAILMIGEVCEVYEVEDNLGGIPEHVCGLYDFIYQNDKCPACEYWDMINKAGRPNAL